MRSLGIKAGRRAAVLALPFKIPDGPDVWFATFPQYDATTRYLLANLLPEQDILEYIRGLVLPGAHYLDCGANIGVHSIYYAKCCHAERVVAVEAVPTIGYRLLATVVMNDEHRRIEVSIPPGVDTGSVVHIRMDEGRDLYIKIKVTSHRRFQREGADLVTEADVPLFEALLGGEIEVATLTGKVRLKVPVGSQNGQRVRLSGKGMPPKRKGGSPGDLYVVLRPKLPTDLTEEEQELVGRLKELRDKKG